MLEKGISVLRSMVGRGQRGVTFKFDKAKYPDDLAEVPNDAFERSRTVCLVQHTGFVFASDLIAFEFSGWFRAFEQVIEGDDNSIIPPVMANVSVQLQQVEKSSESSLDMSFNIPDLTKRLDSKDPRIRYICNGVYSPPPGRQDVRFRVEVEIDQNCQVNVVKTERIGGDGELRDNSPNGFSVTVEAGP